MNFSLDQRFVFILRFLYRQGKKKQKCQKSGNFPENWQKYKRHQQKFTFFCIYMMYVQKAPKNQ